MDLQKLFDHIDDSIKRAGSPFFLGAIILVEYPSWDEIQAIKNKILRPILVDKKPGSGSVNFILVEKNGWGTSGFLSFCLSGHFEWINQGHDFDKLAYEDLHQYAKEKRIPPLELIEKKYSGGKD
jgi:hypothetical protein